MGSRLWTRIMVGQLPQRQLLLQLFLRLLLLL